MLALKNSPHQTLPSDCATSVGNDDLAKLLYLVECGNGPDEDIGPTDCDWWQVPSPPGKPAKTTKADIAALRDLKSSPQAKAVRAQLAELGD